MRRQFFIMPVAVVCATIPLRFAVAEECTIATVGEQVLEERRASPPPANVDGESRAAPAHGAVYRVRLRCGERDVFAVFTSQKGFDTNAFRPGARVTIEERSEQLVMRTPSGATATGHSVRPK